MDDIQSPAKTVRGPYRSRLRPTPRQTSHNKKRRAEAATPDHLPPQESQVSCVLPITSDTSVTELTDATELADATELTDVTGSMTMSIESSEGHATSDDQAANSPTGIGGSSENDDGVLSMAGSKPKLYHGSILTVDTSCLLVDSFVNRHHLSTQCKEDLLQLMHLHLPSDNQLPPTLHKFKGNAMCMTADSDIISEHFYCHKCFTPYQSEEKNLCPNVECGFAFESHSFVTLPLSTQIQLLMKSMHIIVNMIIYYLYHYTFLFQNQDFISL